MEYLEITIASRMTLRQYRKFKQISKRYNLTRSKLIRKILTDFLEKENINQNLNK